MRSCGRRATQGTGSVHSGHQSRPTTADRTLVAARRLHREARFSARRAAPARLAHGTRSRPEAPPLQPPTPPHNPRPRSRPRELVAEPHTSSLTPHQCTMACAPQTRRNCAHGEERIAFSPTPRCEPRYTPTPSSATPPWANPHSAFLVATPSSSQITRKRPSPTVTHAHAHLCPPHLPSPPHPPQTAAAMLTQLAAAHSPHRPRVR